MHGVADSKSLHSRDIQDWRLIPVAIESMRCAVDESDYMHRQVEIQEASEVVE
jgi:hypothetical protein